MLTARPSPVRACLVAALGLLLAGCGINKSRLATEQLVVSDAVDRAVASIDFSPLSGNKVYFDTKYVEGVSLGPGGSMPYLISSLRQQMLAYDCRLQDKVEDADFVVEARVGVLQHDGHEVTYGVPGSAALGTASLLMASPIPLPALPELSLGRRNHQSGTAKLGMFAYDRETRQPVWQAGVTKGSSQSRDMWILGLGPYHKRPSETKRRSMFELWNARAPVATSRDPLTAYSNSLVFDRASDLHKQKETAAATAEVATVSHEQPANEPAKAATAELTTVPVPFAKVPAQEPAPIVPVADAKPVPPPIPYQRR